MAVARMSACLALSWLLALASARGASVVELKPVAISLDAPPRAETRRSCVGFRGHHTAFLRL